MVQLGFSLGLHELVTFYCRFSLYLKSFVLCNSNIDDGVADRHLDQGEGLDAGVLGGWGQITHRMTDWISEKLHLFSYIT